MRTVTLIVVHCSATREGQSFDFEQCRRDHIRHRRFRDIGYHFYLTREARYTADGRWNKWEPTAGTTTGTA